ncbi:Flp pilus assembly protein CpaB [Thalassotalea litorea]|uniref:Flp pilus assembly protein CpaB n=1 Tax=Thalassotalea litorea TaxID=2020715 RepID=UPI00373544CA
MTKNTLVFILLSLAFGLGAVYMARNWIADNQPKQATNGKVKVVTVNSELPMGTAIEPKHLSDKLVPKDMVPDGAFTEQGQIKDMLVKQHMYPGDIIRQQRVVKKGEGSSLASLIPKNKRAVSLRVNDIVGVAGFILPGDYVDILTTYRRGRSSDTQTELVLSNIKILAIDQRASNDENKPQLVRAVTLELSLKQAEVLMSAKNKGAIQLALRNPHEEVDKALIAKQTESKPQKADALVLSSQTPVNTKPAPAPVAPSTSTRSLDDKVQIIRKVSSETVKVKGSK